MLRWIPPLVATLLLAAPSGAQEPCPEISGEVVLTGDLVCDALWLPDGSTLDLDGFTLTASVIPGTAPSPGADDVTVKNGTIADSLIEFEFCDDCLIEDVHVRGSGSRANTLGDRNTIRRSRFTRAHLDLYYGGDNTIEESHFEQSGIGGSRSDGNAIRRNVFDDGTIFFSNAEDFHGGSFNRIEGNLFLRSSLPAIDLVIGDCFYHPQSGPRDTCVEGNVVAENLFIGGEREAILVGSELDCGQTNECAIHAGALIESNVLIRNGHPEDGSGPYDAIRVVGLPEVVDGFVLRNNRVAFSGDHAIHAPGVTDGGGNRAVRSGNPEPCVGVDCRPPGLRGPRAPLRPVAPGKANGARRLRAGEHR